MIESNQGLKDHPLFTAIDSLSSTLEKLKQSEHYLPNIDKIERLAGLSKLLEANVRGSQDALTPSFAFEQGQQHAQNCVKQINNFVSNGGLTHLTAALTDIESAIRVFPSAYRIRDPKQSEEFVSQMSDALNNFVELTDQKADEFWSQIDEMRSLLAGFEEELGGQSSTLKKISSDADKSLSEINEEFQKRQIERANTFSEQTQKFSERINVVIEEHAASVASVIDSGNDQISSALAEFREKFENLLAEATEIRDEIRKLAGLSGTEALVGRFHSVGKRQRLVAGCYRFFAYAGFLAAAIFLAWIAYEGLQSQNGYGDWQSVLAKSQLALFLLIPSTFLAIELRSINRQQSRLQDLELLITAFGPFIDDLPDAEKTKLKETMAPIFFHVERSAPDKEQSLSAENISMFEKIAKLFRG